MRKMYRDDGGVKRQHNVDKVWLHSRRVLSTQRVVLIKRRRVFGDISSCPCSLLYSPPDRWLCTLSNSSYALIAYVFIANGTEWCRWLFIIIRADIVLNINCFIIKIFMIRKTVDWISAEQHFLKSTSCFPSM